MGVQLEIADGSPWWYLSESIWPVPGPNPGGPPGIPRVGQPSYLWARVTNTGDTAVEGADVSFWWANPATAMTYGDLVPVGRSRVSLKPEETKEVLCLSKWVPAGVNGGHECLIAVAYSPAEPLPRPQAADVLAVTTDPRVAQRNLTLEGVAPGGLIALPFIARNPHLDRDLGITLALRRASLEEYPSRTLGEWWPRGEIGADVPAGLAEGNDVGPEGEGRMDRDAPWDGRRPEHLSSELAFGLGPGQAREAILVVRMPEDAREGEGALILVEQYDERELAGGCGFIVVAARGDDGRQSAANS